ncbi:MAG: sigma-70 family RNA polymerase sigma factor [Acidimicrobiales bacterium]
MTTGREERFRRLFDQGRWPVLAYALRRTRSAEDAADVLAETFAIAWRRLDDVPPDPLALSWLYGTARGVVANLGRRTATRSALVERLGVELSRREQVPADSVLSEPGILAKALARLNEDDREVLMLAAWEELGSKELGQALGCSPTAARLRLHRARARLRAHLEDEPLPPDLPTAVGHVPVKEVHNHGRAPVVADG